MKRRDALLLLALAAAIPAAPAQTGKKWPERPVRMIVALSPGGSVDTIARMVAARLSEKFGEQFIVDNRVGAGTILETIQASASLTSAQASLIDARVDYLVNRADLQRATGRNVTSR